MDNDLKIACLNKHWKSHYNIATDDRVRRRLNGEKFENIRSQNVSGGSPLDLATSMSIIIVAIQLVNLAITIEKYLYEKKKRTPTPEELNEKLLEEETEGIPKPVIKKSLDVCITVVEWKSKERS